MNFKSKALICLVALGLGACAAIPPAGPSVMVLPGTGSTFDRFRQDQAVCEQFARGSIGEATPAQAAENSAVNSAAVGAAVGAAAGSVIGAASGDPGGGAAVGAGIGMLGGTLSGIDAYNQTAYVMQERYDTAYVQCMYSKGHQVPVPAGYQMTPQSQQQAVTTAPPPPPSRNAAPPGYPPSNAPPPPRPPGTR